MNWKAPTTLPLINMIMGLFCYRGTISMEELEEEREGKSIMCLKGTANPMARREPKGRPL